MGFYGKVASFNTKNGLSDPKMIYYHDSAKRSVRIDIAISRAAEVSQIWRGRPESFWEWGKMERGSSHPSPEVCLSL
jgi:hypothetical protein